MSWWNFKKLWKLKSAFQLADVTATLYIPFSLVPLSKEDMRMVEMKIYS